MRKTIFILLAAILTTMIVSTTGCTSKDPKGDSIVKAESKPAIDTIANTMDATDSLVAATPMPKRADELFDDFFFNFYINKKLQLSRIAFPLSITENGTERKVTMKEWQMDHFFRHQDFYSVIGSSRKALTAAADTSISTVTVEKLQIKDNVIRQYVFNRIDGQWKMLAIKNVSLNAHGDSSFLQFLYNFATNDEFQSRSLASKISYTGPSDEDDDKTVTTNITPGEWEYKIHAFPDNFEEFVNGEGFYDIIYGGANTNGNTRIVSFRGIANGNEIKYTFNKAAGSWQLVKYEM